MNLRRLPIRSLFALVLAIIVANGAVSFWTFDRLIESGQWVRHTQEVRQLLSDVLTALLDAETGQRGYLVTRDAGYLGPFREGSVIVGQKLDQLAAEVGDNPAQAADVDHLRALAKDALGRLSAGLANSNAGVDNAALSPAMSEARSVMDNIRATISAMDSHEAALLNDRLSSYNAVRTTAALNQIVFLALSLGLVALLYFFIRRDAKQRADALAEHAEHAAELDRGLKTLATERNEIARLNEASTFLQSCNSIDEFSRLAQPLLQSLFPGRGGAVYVYAASRNQLKCSSAWGNASGDPETLDPAQCWALRRGALHHFATGGGAPRCSHLDHVGMFADAQCVPLVAHGETLGLLTVRSVDRRPEAEATGDRLIAMVARQLALTLANLQLRQTLKDQSMRDPLTGAFNRRYLEVVGEKELQQSTRNDRGCAVVMLDVDHFKRFNDVHGHAAGDVALVAVADYLQKNIRSSDWLFRYGGEEFVILLRETSRVEAEERVAAICEGIAAMPIAKDGKAFPRVTVSMGVAVFPEHGETLETLLLRADEALYVSKTAGRNRFSFALAA
jgi:diguanylate cyclase (GGDEF)-like protein